MLSLLFFLLAVLPLGAETTNLPDPSDPSVDIDVRLERLVERVKLEQAKVTTMEAGFTQLRESILLLEPENSEGTFLYRAPDRILWRYESPKPRSILVTEEAMWTYYEELAKAEKIEIGQYSERVFQYMGAGGSIESLQEFFEVKASFPKDSSLPYRLKLKPRFRRVEKRVAGITIWIDSQLFVPIRVRYEEPDGGITEYAFQNLELNTELADASFDLQIPEDVVVEEMALSQR